MVTAHGCALDEGRCVRCAGPGVIASSDRRSNFAALEGCCARTLLKVHRDQSKRQVANDQPLPA